MQVCKHAADKRVGKVVAEAAQMYTGGDTNEGNSGTGSVDKDARWVCNFLGSQAHSHSAMLC
jgi:hypothetical protein